MRVVSLILVLFLFSAESKGQENCQLKKDQEGIKVYLCETPGSPFKTIKVHFEVKTSLKEYAAGILDISNYKKWQYNIVNSHILKNINAKELIYYSEVQTPWPIEHRDLNFHLKIMQDSVSKVLTVTLKELPDYSPHKEDIVRIPKAQSLLTVTPLNKGLVKVDYVIHVDPGGEVPAFLANLFAAQTPWQTFKNYRTLLQSNTTPVESVPFITNYDSRQAKGNKLH